MFETAWSRLEGWDLSNNVIAGLTVSCLAIPQAVSNAALAGLPVPNSIIGLCQFAYPCFGKSRYLIVGSVANIAFLSAKFVSYSTTADVNSNEWIAAMSTLAFLTGAWQILFSITPIGKNLVALLHPDSLWAISTSGAVNLILLQQSSILRTVHSVLLACMGFVLIEFMKHRHSSLGPLTVVCLGSILGYFQLLDADLVGELNAQLPGPNVSALMFPNFQSSWPKLIGFSLLLAILTSVDSIAMIQWFEPQMVFLVEPELMALGVGNLLTAIFQGSPVGPSVSRTALNKQSGGTNWISAMTMSFVIILVYSPMSSLLSFFPKSCASAIVLSACWRSIETTRIVGCVMKFGMDARASCCLMILAVGTAMGTDWALLFALAYDLYALV